LGKTLGEEQLKMIQFSWDIHYKCNYDCPYCWFYNKWDEISKLNIYVPLKEMLKYWTNVYKKYGSINIQITGGEPFIYPNFIDLICEISQMHNIGITTNLSFDVKQLEKRISKLNGKNIGIGMSFHPKFVKFETFFEKVTIVKEIGIGNTILYLAWPPQIKEIPKYKEYFLKHKFVFSVLTFWGKYNGIEYPAGYTDEEREIINTALGIRGESGEKFQVIPKITRGKLCNAGHTYALIHPDGKVYRCGGGNWKEQHPPFNNFFSENFSLLNEPLPCDSEVCPCNEWSFLLVK
jgi:MoaA/NifB/PqqE/SkfB family radical SAM enzyme